MSRTIYLIAGPSGSGKTALTQALVHRVPRLSKAVTVTTRQPRPGEVFGVDYHFVTPEQFALVIAVEMDDELKTAYTDIRDAIKHALKKYPRNASLTSLMLNTLLCYPDHPFGFDALYAKVKNKQVGVMEKVHICDPAELDKSKLTSKERALLEDVKAELAQGSRSQVYATFTGAHDVTARLKWVFDQAGIRVAVLKSSVATDAREAWYKARLSEGVQVAATGAPSAFS